jgi:2-polyprenyl-3-methyl-5-hydroxy-6-metoxy-1,4-benzoquinol methylase
MVSNVSPEGCDAVMESVEPTIYYGDPRTEMIRFVPPTSRRVLDLGCGEGRFGELLKDKIQCEIWGIELDERAARVAESKYDRIICGDFLTLKNELPEGYFDCIVVNDVIEHFADPSSVLFRLKKLLIPNGNLVFSIPNVRYFENLYELIIQKDWKYRSAGILDVGHLRFYTKKSIVRLFEENGFEVNFIAGVNKRYSRRLFKYAHLFLNLLTFNFFADAGYLQFAGVVCSVGENVISKKKRKYPGGHR